MNARAEGREAEAEEECAEGEGFELRFIMGTQDLKGATVSEENRDRKIGAHLDGDLVRLLDEVLLFGGLVALEAVLELFDLIGHAGIVGHPRLGALLLKGRIGEGMLVVQRRQGVRCVCHGGIDWGKGPREGVSDCKTYIRRVSQEGKPKVPKVVGQHMVLLMVVSPVRYRGWPGTEGAKKDGSSGSNELITFATERGGGGRYAVLRQARPAGFGLDHLFFWLS